jgi:hypothetical protein
MTQAGNNGEDLPEAEGVQRRLAGFRSELYRCLTVRADELFELADAVLWQAFLRRFDLEHTFRLFKQVLGWTASGPRSSCSRPSPSTRSPAAARPTGKSERAWVHAPATVGRYLLCALLFCPRTR